MIPYRSCFATAVPRTPEVRLKIAEAIRAFIAHENDEPLPGWRTNLASLRRELGEIALALQEPKRECDPRLRSHVLRYNPDQPRVPAGSPDGGQWTGEVASDSSNSSGTESDAKPKNEYASNDENDGITNDNLTAEQVCRLAYSEGLASVRMNPSLSPAAYLNARYQLASALELCLNLANGVRPIPRDGAFVSFFSAGVAIFRPGRSPRYVRPQSEQ